VDLRPRQAPSLRLDLSRQRRYDLESTFAAWRLHATTGYNYRLGDQPARTSLMTTYVDATNSDSLGTFGVWYLQLGQLFTLARTLSVTLNADLTHRTFGERVARQPGGDVALTATLWRRLSGSAGGRATHTATDMGWITGYFVRASLPLGEHLRLSTSWQRRYFQDPLQPDADTGDLFGHLNLLVQW
ncbi:MAG: hypothetical protein WBA12_14850, partial [Catalinimonas sp.]